MYFSQKLNFHARTSRNNHSGNTGTMDGVEAENSRDSPTDYYRIIGRAHCNTVYSRRDKIDPAQIY
jgi:hypothetical protein